MANHRIQNFRLIDHHSLRASFDIDFGPVLVKGFNLVEANGGMFISEPSEQFQDRNSGERKFKKIALFADDLVKSAIESNVRSLYAAHRQPEQQRQVPPAEQYQHPDEIPF